MKKTTLFAALLACAQLSVLFTPGAAQGNQTPHGGAGPVALSKAGEADKGVNNIRLRNAPLTTLLSVLSRQSGLKFSISDPELAGERVTVFIRNAKPDAVMELLMKTKGLDFRRLGNSDTFAVVRDTAPFEGFPPMTRKDMEDPLLNRVVSVRLKGVLLPVFLDVISAQVKVNFMISGDASYIPISADLSKITVVDVLQFLKTKGLSYSRVGDTNTFVVRAVAGGGKNGVAEANKAFGEKNYERSIEIYGEFLKVEPESEMADYALLQMAVSYDWIAARDNSASALKNEEQVLRRLIKDYPKSSRLGDAYLYLGQIYSGFGGAKFGPPDCKKAIQFYDLALKSTYRDWVKAQAGARIAQCYEMAGDKEKAAAMYREVAERYPDTATAKELREPLKGGDALLKAGAALAEQSEYKLAIEVYGRVVEKGAPEDSVREAELRIGLCQVAMKDPEKAVKTYAAYLAKYKPESRDKVYLLMGQALEQAGRGNEAKEYLEKAGVTIKTGN